MNYFHPGTTHFSLHNVERGGRSEKALDPNSDEPKSEDRQARRNRQ